VLTEEQKLLAKSASEWVSASAPIARLRKLRDAADPIGYSRDEYARMAELGWTAIPFADEHGGASLGMAELAVVLEALGRGLAPEPLFSSVLLGGLSVSLGGTPEQKARLLPGLIAGEKLITLAYQERASRHDPFRVTTRAERGASGVTLRGSKTQVLDAHVADALVVVARSSGEAGTRDGITLALVERGAKGLEIVRQSRVDSRNAAIVELDGVEVGEAAILGGIGNGGEILERVLDRATLGISAEMLGGMSEAFERTLAYLKERVQFGVPIGSFQALKHRAARLFIEIELCRSLVMAAARALDDGLEEAPRLVSAAKARCSDAFLQVANEAIQMHGGIGMTDEHDIGFFLKRARAAEMTLGDATHHRARFARLSGY
jgi:alkylation response protein AidB-like acyl-CoA dehydrogenase